MEIYVHDLGNDIKRDFCKHFTTIYVRDNLPAMGDIVTFTCPTCDSQYQLGSLHAWTKFDTGTPPEGAVEATISNDDEAISC